MSSLRQSLNSLNDQKTEPNEQCEEVDHVTDSIDHECVQAYGSMCIEDVVLYHGCYRIHLWNHRENKIERTKQIEVDCHFIIEKIASGCMTISFVNSNDQLTDIFTKSLKGPRIKYICDKLGAFDLYAPAWRGGVLMFSLLIHL